MPQLQVQIDKDWGWVERSINEWRTTLRTLRHSGDDVSASQGRAKSRWPLVMEPHQSFCCCQTGSMEATTAPSIETRLPLLAAAIGAHIPGAQVRLFGSRARGNASPDSDIDLLITVPDIWLASHDRWLTLSELRRRLAMVDVSLDLLLFSEAEVAERQHWQSHVIGQAYREGQLLHGPL